MVERLDERNAPLASNLVVYQVQNANGAAGPVRVGIFLGFERCAPIADEQRFGMFPCGFQAHVIVDAAVGQNRSSGEGRPLQGR